MNMLPFLAFMPGAPEWFVILLIVLLLFGAKRLPDLARSLGKSLSEFKKGREEGLGKSEEEEKNSSTKSGSGKDGG